MSGHQNLEDYEVLGVIGTGSFGTCYKVRNKLSKKIFVWKAIDYGKMTEETKQMLVSEVNLLSELDHPNIVCYYDRILHRETTTIYIIMEWCQGGDLASLISNHKKNGIYVSEKFVWRTLYQTGRALQACHSRLTHVTVLHRDIKPANVFLDESGNIKLGDFGLARILHGDDDCSETVVGTPFYMSPEIIKGNKYNRKSDIWALGCLVYELCALSPPFVGTDIKQLAICIKEGKFKRIPTIYSDDLQKIIELLLSTEHEYRPTIEMILHHPTVVVHISQRKTSLKSIGKVDINKSDCEKILQNKKIKPQTEVDTEIKNCLDLKQVANKIKTLNLLEREPEDVSQDIFQGKWLVRLEALRQKEAQLRKKEEGLLEKERILSRKEKQLSLMERITKEKMSRAEVYLHQCRENRTSVSVLSKPTKAAPIHEDLDTSFSADPGDTSILPTSAKIDPSSFLFTRAASERRPKHVHFIPYEKRALNVAQWDNIIASQVTKPINVNKGCLKSAISSNENVSRDHTISKQIQYQEERTLWLENKRAAYTTTKSNKENILCKDKRASKSKFPSFGKKNNIRN